MPTVMVGVKRNRVRYQVFDPEPDGDPEVVPADHKVDFPEYLWKERELERFLMRCPMAILMAAGIGGSVGSKRAWRQVGDVDLVLPLDGGSRVVAVELKREVERAGDPIAQLARNLPRLRDSPALGKKHVLAGIIVLRSQVPKLVDRHVQGSRHTVAWSRTDGGRSVGRPFVLGWDIVQVGKRPMLRLADEEACRTSRDRRPRLSNEETILVEQEGVRVRVRRRTNVVRIEVEATSSLRDAWLLSVGPDPLWDRIKAPTGFRKIDPDELSQRVTRTFEANGPADDYDEKRLKLIVRNLHARAVAVRKRVRPLKGRHRSR